NLLRAAALQQLGGFHQRTASGDHIVHDHCCFAIDITNDVNHLGFVCIWTLLGDDCKRPLGPRAEILGTANTSSVWTHHHDVTTDFGAERACKQWCGTQVI